MESDANWKIKVVKHRSLKVIENAGIREPSPSDLPNGSISISMAETRKAITPSAPRKVIIPLLGYHTVCEAVYAFRKDRQVVGSLMPAIAGYSGLFPIDRFMVQLYGEHARHRVAFAEDRKSAGMVFGKINIRRISESRSSDTASSK